MFEFDYVQVRPTLHSGGPTTTTHRKIKFWDDQKDFVSHRDVGTVSVDRILRLIVISLIFSLDYVCYTCFMDFDIHYLYTNIN